MPLADPTGFDLICTLTPDAQSIDDNGHVNVAWYSLFLEKAADTWFPGIGMSSGYKEKEGGSFFSSETHLKFFREVLPGGRMAIHARVSELSPKAMLCDFLMVDPQTRELIAAQEMLWIHVDLDTRRVSAMREPLAGRLRELVARQAPLGGPLPFRRAIEFRR